MTDESITVMADNSIADALVLLIAQKEAQKKVVQERHKDELKEVDKDIRNTRAKLAEHCIHPTTRKEDFFDYHKREEWTYTYCTVCQKMLSRV